MAVKQRTTKPAVKAESKSVAQESQEVVKAEVLVAQEVQAIEDPIAFTVTEEVAAKGAKELDQLTESYVTEERKDPVVMQAIEEGLKGKSGITVKQNILVQGDSMILVHSLQSAIVRGARLTGEFPQLNNFPKYIKLQVELDLSDDEWVSDVANGLHCSPIAAKALIFDKETMDSLPWETFRKVVNKHGVQGRDRKVMLNEYLKKTDQ